MAHLRLSIASFGIAVATSFAQSTASVQPVTLADAEQRMLKSVATGSEYQIDVALPPDYPTSKEKRYAVVYTLDGNVYFPLLTDTVRLLRINGLLRDDLLIVGIGYPGKMYPYAFNDQSYIKSRGHDYSTKVSPRFLKNHGPQQAEPGGAPAFLRFVREELIPYIDSTYRTVPDERTLIGHSMGGLFAVYVLTHQPEAFRSYAIGSPSLWWDDEVSLQWESEYAANHKDLPARVYLYLGGMEPDLMSAPPQHLWDHLKLRHYPSLDLVDFVRVPGEVHLSVNVSSIERALRSFYGPRPASLSAEVLQRYEGEWTDGSASVWKTRLDGDHLYLDPPGTTAPSRELIARSETSFATDLSFTSEFQLIFTLDGARKTPAELKLHRMPRIEAGEYRQAQTLVLHRAR